MTLDLTWTTTEYDHRVPNPFQARLLHALLIGGCIVASVCVVRAAALLGSSDVRMSTLELAVLICGIWLVFVNAVDSYQVTIGSQRADSHLDDPVLLPILLIYGWHVAFLVALTKHIISQIVHRKLWYKTTFNIAASGISLGLAEAVGRTISPTMSIEASSVSVIVASFVSAFLLTGVSHALTSIAIFSSTPGASWSTMLHDNRIAHLNVIEIFLAAVATVAWRVHAAAVLPVYLVCTIVLRGWRHLTFQDRSREAFLDRLVQEIEYRNPYAQGHSNRVEQIATALAVEADADQNLLSDVRRAGRWHDIGKVSIPDALLLKSTKLYESEKELAREHVNIAENLLTRLNVPQSVTQAVIEHHERIDGSGYPKGDRLKWVSSAGQIVGLAEVFDALTTEQPFRMARSTEIAVRELQLMARENVFDPKLVRLLIQVLKRTEELPATFAVDPNNEGEDEMQDTSNSETVIDLRTWRDKPNDNGE